VTTGPKDRMRHRAAQSITSGKLLVSLGHGFSRAEKCQKFSGLYPLRSNINWATQFRGQSSPATTFNVN